LNINPTFIATEGVKQQFLPSETIYAIQKVDMYFDLKWNLHIFTLAAEGNEIRERYINGYEIGDTANEGNDRYHIITA
jgi:hypothetical protein